MARKASRKSSVGSMTVVELKAHCKKLGIKGYSTMRKAELVKACKSGKPSRKASRKGSKKASRKGSRKGSRKSSNCVVRGGSKACAGSKVCDPSTKRCRAPKPRGRKSSKRSSRKTSRKTSKKASRKTSKKASRKTSKRASRKGSKKKTTLKAGEAYCVSCGKKCKVVKPKYVAVKKGKRTTYFLKGKCPSGDNVAKIVSKDTYMANK